MSGKTNVAFADEASEARTKELLEKYGITAQELGRLIHDINFELSRAMLRVCKKIFFESSLSEIFESNQKDFLGSLIITAAACVQGRVLKERPDHDYKNQLDIILKNIEMQATGLSPEMPADEKEVN